MCAVNLLRLNAVLPGASTLVLLPGSLRTSSKQFGCSHDAASFGNAACCVCGAMGILGNLCGNQCSIWSCCAGQSTDLSFLDPINRADTPPKAIQLAAGELSLRVLETRRRLDAGLGRIQDTIQRCRMAGTPGQAPALPAPAICLLARQSLPEAVLRSEACTLHLPYGQAGRQPHYFRCADLGHRHLQRIHVQH